MVCLWVLSPGGLRERENVNLLPTPASMVSAASPPCLRIQRVTHFLISIAQCRKRVFKFRSLLFIFCSGKSVLSIAVRVYIANTTVFIFLSFLSILILVFFLLSQQIHFILLLIDATSKVPTQKSPLLCD